MTACFSDHVAVHEPSRRSGRHARRVLAAAAVVVGLGAATACAGGGDSGETSVAQSDQVAGVADLADAEPEEVALGEELDDGGDGSASDGEPSSEMSPEDAALAFSQCMRDNGLDVGDLTLQNGRPNFGAAFEGQDRQSPEFRAAVEECRPIMTAVFGDRRAAIADNVEIQDALIEFSDCVRDDGWDVGDLAFGPGTGQGGNGQGGQGAGGQQGQAAGAGTPAPGADNQGGGQGEGLGRRRARIARRMGLDPEDPAVVETIQSCFPILTEAFTSAGLRGGGQGGGQAGGGQGGDQ